MSDPAKANDGDASHSGEQRLYEALRVYFQANDPAQRERLLAEHPDLESELAPLVQSEVVVTPEDQLAAAVPPAALAEPAPGARIGDFRLLRRLGEGGMGVVFEAEQVSLRRRVALKVLLGGSSANARRRARFRREAEAGGRVQHKNIVAVYTVGEENGVPFIAQELIDEGRSLADWIEERLATVGKAGHDPEWERRIAEFFSQAALAVQAAHDAGVLHRDLKPRNLLVTPEGEPKIADFGLALMRASLEISQSGDQIGTPHYMSPEQIDPALGEVDERSDVFSLGAALYEALTLGKPFPGEAQPAIFQAILSDIPVDPVGEQPRLSRDLAAICQKALERRPVKRYATTRAFAEDLERFLDGAPTTARPSGFVDDLLRTVKRYRLVLAASLAIVIALGFVIRSQREIDRTQQLKEVAFRSSLSIQRRSLLDPDTLRSELRFGRERDAALELVRSNLDAEPKFAADMLELIAFAAIVRERSAEDRATAIDCLEDAAQRLDSIDRVRGGLCALRSARLAEHAGARDTARQTRKQWISRLSRDGREEARSLGRVMGALEHLADWYQGRFQDPAAARATLANEAGALVALESSTRVSWVAREIAAEIHFILGGFSTAAELLSTVRKERMKPEAVSGEEDLFSTLDAFDDLSLRAVALVRSGDVATADHVIDWCISERERKFVDGSASTVRDRLRSAEVELAKGNRTVLAQVVEPILVHLDGLGRRLSEDAIEASRLLAEIRMVAADGATQQNRSYQLGLAVEDLERAIATARAVRGEQHPDVTALSAKLTQLRVLAEKEPN